MHQQAHQAGDFVGGTLPVFRAEGKQREIVNAACRAGFDNLANPTRATDMAERARHAALGGPAAVSIHDDGHVLRHGCW